MKITNDIDSGCLYEEIEREREINRPKSRYVWKDGIIEQKFKDESGKKENDGEKTFSFSPQKMRSKRRNV